MVEPPSKRARQEPTHDWSDYCAECHRRAMQYGAHGLDHAAELPNARARQRFRRSCMAAAGAAAAGGAAWSAGLSGERDRPLARPPTPSESAERYLLMGREFCHGLGHEVVSA